MDSTSLMQSHTHDVINIPTTDTQMIFVAAGQVSSIRFIMLMSAVEIGHMISLKS